MDNFQEVKDLIFLYLGDTWIRSYWELKKKFVSSKSLVVSYDITIQKLSANIINFKTNFIQNNGKFNIYQFFTGIVKYA